MRWSLLRRLAPLLVIVALVALAYGLGLHRHISFETLVRHNAEIERFIGQHTAAAVAAYVALYILVVTLSLPGGAILTVIGGLLFGVLVGSMAAAVGALIGATAIFLIARSAAGEFLTRRAGPFAAKLAEGFRADAFSYLLFLRLVPFPFWLVNLAPALFGVRLSTYVAATAIGIVPATLAFAAFGAGLESVIVAQEAHVQHLYRRRRRRLPGRVRSVERADAGPARRAGGAGRAGARSRGGAPGVRAQARHRHSARTVMIPTLQGIARRGF